MNKKGQGLSMETIIIVILILIVLVLVIIFFTGGFCNFSEKIKNISFGTDEQEIEDIGNHKYWKTLELKNITYTITPHINIKYPLNAKIVDKIEINVNGILYWVSKEDLISESRTLDKKIICAENEIDSNDYNIMNIDDIDNYINQELENDYYSEPQRAEICNEGAIEIPNFDYNDVFSLIPNELICCLDGSNYCYKEQFNQEITFKRNFVQHCEDAIICCSDEGNNCYKSSTTC